MPINPKFLHPENMTDEEIEAAIKQLRKEAEADRRHAEALRKWVIAKFGPRLENGQNEPDSAPKAHSRKSHIREVKLIK